MDRILIPENWWERHETGRGSPVWGKRKNQNSMLHVREVERTLKWLVRLLVGMPSWLESAPFGAAWHPAFPGSCRT